MQIPDKTPGYSYELVEQILFQNKMRKNRKERPSGCVFNTRCGEVLGDQCSADIPSFTSFGKSRRVACHLYRDGSGA